jgi:hypothetical protein
VEPQAVTDVRSGILPSSRNVSCSAGILANLAMKNKTPPTTGSRGITRFVVALFLAIHAGLLAWQAYRYSPTID